MSGFFSTGGFGATAGFGGMAAGAAGLLGSGLSGALSAAESKKARDFQKKVLTRRYQWMVGDLKKAGINPILAASLGAGGPASAAAASFPDFGQSMARGVEAGVKGAKADAERRLIEEQTQQAAAQKEFAQNSALKAAQDAQVAAAKFRQINQEMRYMARKNWKLLPEEVQAEEYMDGWREIGGDAGKEVRKLWQDFEGAREGASRIYDWVRPIFGEPRGSDR